MVFNVFVVKKWVVLLLFPILVTVSFLIGFLFGNMIVGLLIMLVAVIVFSLLGTMLLRNPFTMMMEGKGLMAINMDSTGIIRPFIVSLQRPFITGRLGKKQVRDVFDRATVTQITAPEIAKEPATVSDDGTIKFEIPQKLYNQARFALYHYPVVLYNEQVNSIITKDMLSEGEKAIFAEHMVLYLNRKIEELTSQVRDFSRYVVESLKPKDSIWGNKWLWTVIIIAAIIIMAIMFGPLVFNAVTKASGGAGNAISGVLDSSNPIVGGMMYALFRPC